MGQIRVDFSGVTNFEPLPTGAYPVIIKKVELKDSSNGPWQNLNWELEVIDGEFTGRKLFLTTTLKPEGLFKLVELLEACGEEVQLEELDLDPDAYVGRQLLVGVSVGSYNGKPSNNIDKLEALG
jgi:hypothetical protein